MILPTDSLKATKLMGSERAARWCHSRVFKALLIFVAVWTVAFTVFANIDILARWSTGVHRSSFSQLVHGSNTSHVSPSYSSAHSSIPPETPEILPHDTLITYVYSESRFGRENIKFFIQIGLHRAADFVFIFNGDTDAYTLLPEWDNIEIVRRNNTCYDMGAVGEVLRNGDRWKRYSKFISINASLRGPFIPYWSNSCWTDLYLNKITDTVKFIGLTANCNPRPHVQSMIFATDDIGMAILLDPEHSTTGVADKYGSENDTVGLSGCYMTHKLAVHSEIGLATLIINAGYQVDVMMAAFHQEETLETYCNVTNKGDVLGNNDYYGFNIHPYETIFFKTNRKIDPEAIKMLSEWHLKRNVTSETLCPAKMSPSS